MLTYNQQQARIAEEIARLSDRIALFGGKKRVARQAGSLDTVVDLEAQIEGLKQSRVRLMAGAL